MVEVAGAVAPAVAAGFAAAGLAPLGGWPTGTAMLVAAGCVFAAAFAAMRAVAPEQRRFALPHFVAAALPDDELLLGSCEEASELLLDQPLVEAETAAVATLLLDDPLPDPDPDSRVVKLFADAPMPTAAQLQQRIDRHLAEGARPRGCDDASDRLSEALAELRQSLRQA